VNSPFFFLNTKTAAVQSEVAFPYPLYEVAGTSAVSQWKQLNQKEGTAIIIGSLDDVQSVKENFEFSANVTVETILAKAANLSHPSSLYDHITNEHRSFVESLKQQEGQADLAAEMDALNPIHIPDEYWGDWPDQVSSTDSVLSLLDWSTGKPLETVYITILPTKNTWEAAAYLKFGNWNANPPPEIHVAAMKQWAKDFGATPIVMNVDTIELYVDTRPNSQENAKKLAAEQYLYSPDIVNQGVDEVSMLAAILEKNHHWYFWWD